MERLFELCWWDVADETVETFIVLRVGSAEGREF